MKRELVKNTLIIGAGKLSTQFLALLLIPLYTIFLSPEHYGLGDLIITYAMLLSPLVTLGLEQGMFRQMVDARGDNRRLTTIISTSLRIILPIFVSLSLIAALVGWVAAVPVMLAGGAYIATAVLIKVYQWIARGFGNNLAYSVGSIISGLVAASLSVVFIALLDMGVEGMLYALALGNVAGLVYFSIRLNIVKFINFTLYDKSLAKQLLKYSLPLVPNDMSWWGMTAADRTIIALSLGVASTGVYAVAIKFPAVLAGLFAIFWAAWYESASLNIKSERKDELFSKTINTIIVFFGSLALLILAITSVVFPYTVGEQFHEAYIYIPLLMLAAMFGVVAKAYGAIYAAKHQTVKVFTTTLVAAVTGIVTTIALIGVIGLYAAVVGAIVANIVMVVMRHRDINKHTNITINYRGLWPLVLAIALVSYLYYANIPSLNIVSIAVSIFAIFVLNKDVVATLKDVLRRKR